MQKIIATSENLQSIPLHIQHIGRESCSVISNRYKGIAPYSTKDSCRVQMHFFSLVGGHHRLRLRRASLRTEKTVPFLHSFPVVPPLLHLQNTKTTWKTHIDVLVETFQKKALSQLHLIIDHPQEQEVFLRVLHYLPPEILPTQHAACGSLRQTLILSPGEEIVVEASFQRSDAYDAWVRPSLLQDVHLSKKLSYTGFPFPSERVGWTLSSICLPNLPTRSKDYPLIQGMQEKQWCAKQAFQEKNSLRTWIEAHHLLRRQIFDLDAPKWLNHYQTLLEALLCCVDLSRRHFFPHRSVLKNFLAWVAKAPSPFTVLTHVHRRMLVLFLESPYHMLQHQLRSLWTTLPKNPHAKCEAARTLLRHAVSQAEQTMDSSHPVGAYLALVGPKIAKGCENLLLHTLPEKFGVLPPPLSLVERRLQICALQHLLSFLETLEAQPLSPSMIRQQMEREIEEDLHALTGTKVHHLLAWGGAQELEAYFLHHQQTALLSHR